jgi:hypothetical protein
LPVTVRFADKVGDVLSMGSAKGSEKQPFKFYVWAQRQPTFRNSGALQETIWGAGWIIIEAYEHLGREIEIKDGGGNYLMLSDLADRACGESGHKGINLGRDSKKVLKEVKNLGNWSAHARRFLAHAGDLTKFQTGMRFLVQELIQIADLVRKKP